MQLAEPTGRRVRDRDLRGRAPGCRNGRTAAASVDLDAERRRRPLDEALHVVEVRGAGAVAPAAPASSPTRSAARRCGSRRRGPDPREPAPERRPRPPAATAAGTRGPIRTSRPARRRGRGCAAAAPSSPPISVVRIADCSLRERVAITTTGRDRRRRPRARRRGRIDEAARDRLVEADVAQDVLDPAAQGLLARQAADRGAAAGQRRRAAAVEPVDAGDLLDQVGLAVHVAVAVRTGPRPSTSCSPSAP